MRLRLAEFAAFLLLAILPAGGATAQSDLGLGGGGTLAGPVINSNGTMFAGCDMSGVYRSVDSGNHWTLINTRDIVATGAQAAWGGTSGGVFSVAVDPANAKHIIAVHTLQGPKESCSEGADGTWTKYIPSATPCPSTGSSPTWPTNGLTVSAGAISAESTPTVLLGDVNGIVYSVQGNAWQQLGALTPANTAIIRLGFVADSTSATGQRAFAATQAGVYRLDGASWTPSWSWTGTAQWQPPSAITDLAVASDASHYVLYAAAGSSAVYRFGNDTNTWQQLTPSGTDLCFKPNLLGVAASVPNTVYVTGSCSNEAVFRASYTPSSGTTGSSVPTVWAAVYNVANLTGGWLEQKFGWGWGGPAHGFAVHPANVQTAIFTNSGAAHVTTNGGATWSQEYTQGSGSAWTTTGLDVTTTWNYYEHNGRRFIANTDIGLSISDNGQQWTPITSDSQTTWNTFYELAFDNSGNAWAAVSQEHDIPHYSQTDDCKVGGSVNGAVLLSTTTNGSTWTTGYSSSNPVVSVLYRPAFNDVLASVWGISSRPVASSCSSVASAGGVYRYSGGIWSPWGTPPSTGSVHFYQLRADPSGNAYLSVAVSRASNNYTTGALYSIGAGTPSWSNLTATALGTAGAQIAPQDFVIDPSNSNILYLATWGFSGSSDNGGLWKLTLSNGQVASAIQVLTKGTMDAATNAPLFSLSAYQSYLDVFSPSIIGSTLYIGTVGHGIVKSNDGGTTWTHAFPSLRFLGTQRIVGVGDRLFATTFGAGLWNLVSPFDVVLQINDPSTGRTIPVVLSF